MACAEVSTAVAEALVDHGIYDAALELQSNWVADGEVIDYLDAHRAFENSFAVAKDLFGYGQAFIQIVLVFPMC